MELINIHFEKFSGNFGFYDNMKQLNYFKYFDINEADILQMFAILEVNTKNNPNFHKEIESKIVELFKKYCLKIKIQGDFTLKAINNDIEKTNHSYLSIVLLLGCRLLAQEFIMLNNVDKITYNAPITVFKFGNEKFTYKDYMLSLRSFYDSLCAWTLKLISYDENTAYLISVMDKMIKNQNLKLGDYKKIFMLIWMHNVTLQMNESFNFNKQLDTDNNNVSVIQKNVLRPINFDVFFQEVSNFNNPNKLATLEIFKKWTDKSYIQKIKDAQLKQLNSLQYSEGHNFATYFKLVENIGICFSYNTTIDFKKFKQTVLNHLSDNNKFSINFIEETLKNLFNTKIDATSPEIILNYYNLGLYKKPILTFIDKDKYFYIASFPEIIGMSIWAQKEFMLFSEEKRKEVLFEQESLINKEVNKQSLRLSKRFANIKQFEFQDIRYFKNKEIENLLTNLKPNSIIYEPSLGKCFLLFNYLFTKTPTPWSNEQNAMSLTLGKFPFYQNFLQKTYFSWEKDFKKIKKQLKIPKTVKIEMVLVVNRIFNLNPKINCEDFDFYIVDAAQLEYFITSYIYKK